MQWLEGLQLNTYIESILNDQDALQRLADEWITLIKSLKSIGIAHGDLQHGNILVCNGKLKLIDYDGMFVPTLAGQGSHETGHPSYQHPNRSDKDFNAEIDNFAGLAIYTAILAVKCESNLWRQFNNYDNILFSREDFANPSQSKVFAKLFQLPDGEIVRKARALCQACTDSVDKVPDIELTTWQWKIPFPAKNPVSSGQNLNPPQQTKVVASSINSPINKYPPTPITQSPVTIQPNYTQTNPISPHSRSKPSYTPPKTSAIRGIGKTCLIILFFSFVFNVLSKLYKDSTGQSRKEDTSNTSTTTVNSTSPQPLVYTPPPVILSEKEQALSKGWKYQEILLIVDKYNNVIRNFQTKSPWVQTQQWFPNRRPIPDLDIRVNDSTEITETEVQQKLANKEYVYWSQLSSLNKNAICISSRKAPRPGSLEYSQPSPPCDF